MIVRVVLPESAAAKSTLKKLNIGSGYIGKEDWIHLDHSLLVLVARLHVVRLLQALNLLPRSFPSKMPSNMIYRDCRKPLPFEDASVDYIYSSHLLEHLKYFEAKDLLKECNRVLAVNGIIRIVVPDLKLLAGKYLAGDEDYFVNKLKLSVGEAPANWFLDAIYQEKNFRRPSWQGRIRDKYASWHQWMYDFVSLKALLESVGFVNITKCEYKKGNVPDAEALDVLPAISLYLEAEKSKS